MPNCPL